MTPNEEPPTRRIYEQGHAKNYDNFKKLRAIAIGMDAKFAPPDQLHQLPNLAKVEQDAGAALENVNAMRPPNELAIDAQQAAFKPIRKLAPKLIQVAGIYGASEAQQADMRTTANRIVGIRAGSKSEAPDASHSASHTGYANQLNDFDLFVKQYEATNITPSETEYLPETLRAKHADMNAARQAAIDTAIPLRQARDTRDEIFYAEKTGLVDIANAVKNYIRVIIGKDSPEYAQIKNLKFTKINK